MGDVLSQVRDAARSSEVTGTVRIGDRSLGSGASRDDLRREFAAAPAIVPAVSSASDSLLPFVAALDKAGAVIRASGEKFTGNWSFPSDPLGVRQALSRADQIIGATKNREGYTLLAEGGVGQDGVRAVNKLFVENGLKPPLREELVTDIAAGAIEKVVAHFPERGKPSRVTFSDNQSYPGVKKTSDWSALKSDQLVNGEPIIKFDTKGDVEFYLVKASASSVPVSSDNLFSRAQAIVGGITGPDAADRFGSVIYPKVDMNISSEPKWLIGAAAEGTDLRVSQAKLQSKVVLDERGLESTVGVAVGMTRSMEFNQGVPYTFNEDFIVITKFADSSEILNAHLVRADALQK